MRNDGETAAAAAAFGLRLISAATAQEKSFALWRGNLRAALFFSKLPSGCWRHAVPPMGGKLVCLGMDWGVVCALLQAFYPTMSVARKRRLLADLAVLEAVTLEIRKKF